MRILVWLRMRTRSMSAYSSIVVPPNSIGGGGGAGTCDRTSDRAAFEAARGGAVVAAIKVAAMPPVSRMAIAEEAVTGIFTGVVPGWVLAGGRELLGPHNERLALCFKASV